MFKRKYNKYTGGAYGSSVNHGGRGTAKALFVVNTYTGKVDGQLWE